MKKVLSLSFLFAMMLLSSVGRCQSEGRVFKPTNLVKVFGADSVEKTLAWCGGFNNPQFTMGDLNHDGTPDLVVYERYLGVRTFLYEEGKYVYAPKYEANFPPIENFLVLADYNCDNVPDLFQAGFTGIAGFDVWTGYYNTDNELCFRHYQQLYYDNDKNTPFPVNAYCNPSDVPAIVDVDGDGDLDFLAYDVFGTSIDYYKNVQVEEGLPCDSIRIKLKDQCWGKLYQSYRLSYDIPYNCDNSNLELLPGERKTHTGNAICLLDMDGDGDMDYLGGNISFPNVVYCNNGRLPYNSSGPDSMVSQDTTWMSSGHSLLMQIWPAIFNVDIDQDGKKDILVSPNTAAENYHCIAFYKNVGTSKVPSFTYEGDTFLVDKTIDVGTAAYPMFFDYNKDGKPDLFIGSDGYYQPGGALKSRITYYENTSTPGNPSFKLITDNFMDIDTFGFKGIAPAVGDIDNDGKADLILGHSDGTFTYFTNVAASDTVQPVWHLAQLALKDESNTTMNVGGNATPFVYDINKDGKPDLVSGNYAGYIQYFENTSTTTGKVSLKLMNTNLGNAKIERPSSGRYTSVPFIGKMDTTGKDYLLVGSYSGALYRFSGVASGDPSATYKKLDSVYAYIDSAYLLVHNDATYQLGVYDGFRSAPAVADIDGDGLYEMVVGDVWGGLKLYEQDTNAWRDGIGYISKGSQLGDVHIYPNPANSTLHINWDKTFASAGVHISITNMQGQVVLTHDVAKGTYEITLPVSLLPCGIYICTVSSGDNKYHTRLSLIR